MKRTRFAWLLLTVCFVLVEAPAQETAPGAATHQTMDGEPEVVEAGTVPPLPAAAPVPPTQTTVHPLLLWSTTDLGAAVALRAPTVERVRGVGPRRPIPDGGTGNDVCCEFSMGGIRTADDYEQDCGSQIVGQALAPIP